MKTYCVYLHTNKANGKKYIGITHTAPEKRWQNGNGYSKNNYFARAIEKYGWNGFAHEVIESGLTKEEAERTEIRLIAKYKTLDIGHGYNIRPGGDASRHSARSRLKMSVNHADVSGDKNPMFGREFTEEHRRNIGEKSKGRYFSPEVREKIRAATLGKRNPMFGKTHTPEARERLAESKRGEKSPTARAVINVGTGQIFRLVNDAAAFAGLSHSTIVNCCRGRQKTAGNHPDTGERMKWMYHEEWLQLKIHQ